MWVFVSFLKPRPRVNANVSASTNGYPLHHYISTQALNCRTFVLQEEKKKKKKGILNLTFLHPWQLPRNQSCPTCGAGVPQVTNTSLLKLQPLFWLHLSLWLTIYSHFYQVRDWFLSSNDEILIKTYQAPIQTQSWLRNHLICTRIPYT